MSEINIQEILKIGKPTIKVLNDKTITKNQTKHEAPDWDDLINCPEWESIKGFVKQEFYKGEVFQIDEEIPTSLEKHILNNPGYYQRKLIINDDGEEYGWVLMYKKP